MELLKLTQSAVATDGNHITLTFDTDSEPLSVEVNRTALRDMVQGLAGVLGAAQKMAAPSSIQTAEQVVQFRAAPVEKDGVVLSFRAPNMLEYHFGMPSVEAERLAQQVQEAARRKR